MEAYCLKCRARREIRNPRQITMKNGSPATQGTGPVCGTKVSRIGKVAHHVSRSSSSGVFLKAVSPVAAAISSGEGNRFGHPHPETVGALLGHVDEALLYMRSERGSVEFVTDGRRLEVKTGR